MTSTTTTNTILQDLLATQNLIVVAAAEVNRTDRIRLEWDTKHHNAQVHLEALREQARKLARAADNLEDDWRNWPWVTDAGLDRTAPEKAS